MHYLQQHYRWVPGGWCNFSSFDCITYYPHLKRWLLNGACDIGSIDDQLAAAERLFDQYAIDSKVFVRPCTLEKIFTGQLVTVEDFAWTLQRARYANCQILVSSPKPIDREWRVVVHRGTPIASSQYRSEGKLDVREGSPTRLLEFVHSIWTHQSWLPDELFVVDVCESSGALFVIELNSFSCSGWYACNPKAIVTLASQLASTL